VGGKISDMTPQERAAMARDLARERNELKRLPYHPEIGAAIGSLSRRIENLKAGRHVANKG